MTFTHFLNNVNKFILNPIISLLFAIALLIFFYGIFKYISSETSDKGDGKKKIMYGLVGMFIMFSAYGLVHLIIQTFGIQNKSDYHLLQ